MTALLARCTIPNFCVKKKIEFYSSKSVAQDHTIGTKLEFPFTEFSASQLSPMLLLFSRVRLFKTPSFTISWSLLKLMYIELVMPSNHLVFCHPFLLLPSIFPRIRVFSNELILHITWPKYWSFSFSISSSNEYSGLISFRINWFNFIAVQGTLESLLQHYSSKASILLCSAFSAFQLSHTCMPTGKTIALTRWTFVGKVISQLFNMLSRFVITFFCFFPTRSKHLLILWLRSPSAVILEPEKIKSVTVSIVSLSIFHEVMGPDVMILIFWCWVLSQLFHSPLSPSSRVSLALLCFLPQW